MKVKLSTIIFTVILSIFYLQIVSCNRVTNPNKAINEIDPKYLKPGRYQKTSGYNFDNDFIFHGWTNQEAIVKPIGGGNSTHVKKLVSSKYFDIWVDLTNYEKAVNIKDTIWEELISDLQGRYPKLVNIYGARPIDLSLKNNENKVEIIFHEKYFNNNVGGYFWYVYNISINPVYLTEYSIKNIELKAVIVHELQHYINCYYRGTNATKPYNEALSESTYPVSFTNSPYSYNFRITDFSNSSNGRYFFNWKGTKGEDTSGYYETAAYFMYWLYIHGGEKIIKDIVSISKSKNKQIDNQSIADAANKNIPYFAGKDYNTIIFDWYRANFYNNSSGILGYKNNAKIKLHLAVAPGEKIELSPQCAVYTMQDMYDKNKGIKGILLAKLSDSNRKWLLIYNSSSSTKTVYIRNSNIPIWGKEDSNIPVWGRDKSWSHIKTNPIKLIR